MTNRDDDRNELRRLARLQEIADLDLVSAADDPELEAITAEAAARFGLSSSMVSIVLDDAQYFLADHGVGGWMRDAAGTPAEWSFCQYTVLDGAEVVVEDAAVDERMRDSPLVRREGARCYAGIPLVTSRGQTVGSFCVVGTEPRTFSDEEVEVLRGYADRVLELLEARRVTTG